jgi:hypothetical protein
MTNASVLTFSILTIPERERYLQQLLRSIASLSVDRPPRVDIVYNRPLDDSLSDVTERISRLATGLPVEVYFNAGETTIGAGRNLQLSVCRTPLIAFIDDDLTLHDDIVPALLDTLATHPVGMVGFPSLEGDTDTRFKPRDNTPSITRGPLRFMPVQGMLCAGYRALFADLGGFNPRRRFWGEWTELNLRLWRNGFPTAYQMERGFLRHWHDAPSSPTRNMSGREKHVVWGLICTALEYDAVDVNEATEVFWQLIEDRYLAYSYGDELTPRNVLKTVLELVPQISDEWGAIQAFRAQTRSHPFQFAPFHRFSEEEVSTVLTHARTAIMPYRERVTRELARASGALPAVTASPTTADVGTLRSAWGRLRTSIRALRQRF